jgi:hypothetical protein
LSSFCVSSWTLTRKSLFCAQYLVTELWNVNSISWWCLEYCYWWRGTWLLEKWCHRVCRQLLLIRNRSVLRIYRAIIYFQLYQFSWIHWWWNVRWHLNLWFWYLLINYLVTYSVCVLWFITTYAINASHHQRCDFEPRSGEMYSIQHYVIRFVSDLRQSVFFYGYSGFLHQ